jgi:hypothetical protein
VTQGAKNPFGLVVRKNIYFALFLAIFLGDIFCSKTPLFLGDFCQLLKDALWLVFGRRREMRVRHA